MSTSLLRSLLLYTCLALLAWPGQATLDIPAFEYQRKFHQPLNLGECPQREIKVQAGNNSTALEEQRCNLHHRGSVTHIPRELDDSQNVLITSPSRVLAYLGLCGGEAAAFLGILNKGDCLAVEIASRLTFTEKTMVRAFVGYYRKSVDVLDSVETANNMIRDMDRYYRDKVYLKHRSYGTQEVIFVQFRFKSAKMTAAAKNVKLDSRAMSDYMRAVEQRVGKPRRITVITLSTATQDTYELKRFSGKLWDRAVRHVQIKENEMRRTKNNINTNVIFPHLMYTLYPFVEEKNTSLRTSDPIPWEKTSILEIQLRQAISVAKKTSRKCRGNRKKPCRRMRELRRKLIAIHAEIHTVRSEWYNYSMTEKQAFVARYSARVKSYSSVTERVVSSVREMLKREKMKKFKRKKNKPNQIPMLTTGRMNRMHRIRHSRRRSKVRKG
ncbi:uncharacterized protein LOC106013776 [Aplysia californica]|uniref:Uncharacterized protein LOC106013776 n=1 Tax=Aplysia californica TaxID=6500 RepID=A0ABM1ADY2_APLCA|nr:uncharacterized protein LOC106013776 [Aplysia californica]